LKHQSDLLCVVVKCVFVSKKISMLKILEHVGNWDWCLGSDCTESEP